MVHDLVDFDDNRLVSDADETPEKFWTLRRILLLIFAILMIISLLIYSFLAWKLQQPPTIIPVTVPAFESA